MNMNLDRPQSLGKTIEVKTSNRPIKIAYLVPYDELSVNHMLLDALFYESYTRWAGAYTLIVPSGSMEFLDPAYESWLEFFDPDFVCTYVELEKDLVEKIDRVCSPIAFLRHEIRKHDLDDLHWRAFIHDWQHYFRPISSMTTIQSPHAQYPSFMRQKPESEITVITQYGNESTHRLLSDNFGTAFKVHIVTHAIPDLFRTLCLVPPDLSDRIIAGTERCGSIADILSALSNRKALPIARLASAHSEAIPRVEPYEWAHSFNLFIGKTLLDRVHFWNARHFTPSYATTPGAFIIEATFFNDENLISQLGQYLNQNNFLGQENGPAKVSIRSYSHSEEELRSIQDKLSKHTYNSIFVGKNFNVPALPEKKKLKAGYFRRSTDTSTFKLNEDTNTLPAEEPAHFTYIPPRYKGIAKGQWVVELDIQRHNNLSRYSNVVDNWVLPRRRKIVRAFTKNLGKVTIGHRLALLPTTEDFPIGDQSINKEYLYNLSLPDDEIFFQHLVLDFFKYPPDDLRASIVKNSYQDLSISDKGQNLRGVISMVGSLSSAYEILTNKYWRAVLRAGKEDSVKYLVYDREKLNGFLPNDRPTREKLMKKLNVSNIGKVSNFMMNNLTDTLEYLIRTNVFYQVHQWRCQYCGHTNSRSFDGMKIKNSCEICSREYLAPIDLGWTYQLNDFVYRSLIKQTGLPVLWTLGFLHDRFIRGSFWYLPEVDLFEKSDDAETKNEMDIFCVLDGKFYAVEVKLSVSLFINKPGEVDKFIKKINLIQPDIAMLSFERYCEPEENVSATKASLIKASDEIRNHIGSHIELKTIVAYDVQGFNDHPADLGWFGRRTSSIYLASREVSTRGQRKKPLAGKEEKELNR